MTPEPLDYRPPEKVRRLAVPTGVIVGTLIGILLTTIAFIIGMVSTLNARNGDDTFVQLFPSLAVLHVAGFSPSPLGKLCALTLMVCQYPAECALACWLLQKRRWPLAAVVPIAHIVAAVLVS